MSPIAKYVGETIRIRTTITDTDTGVAVTPNLVVVTIWPPDATLSPLITNATMNLVAGTTNKFEYNWETGNVVGGATAAGTYVYKTKATGTTYQQWEYGQITLIANKRP